MRNLQCVQARSHDPILRIRFLVPKIGSRRSYGTISRFRFCGKNVGWSFVVCSHDAIFRTNKASSVWRQNGHRDIMQNLSAPFIFQEECRMKIEHVLFHPFFFKITDPCVGRSCSVCSHDPIFGTNKNRILKNESCERAFTKTNINQIHSLRQVRTLTSKILNWRTCDLHQLNFLAS